MQNSTLVLSQLDQFSSTNVNSAVEGVFSTATANASTNIDLYISDDCFLIGGSLLTNQAAFGDYAKFQVVDVDNTLGLGANLVLGEYIKSWYMRSDVQLQLNETVVYPAKIKAGLYLRVVYVSTGQNNVSVAINYRLHKALY